jgi:prepilin-type N-terminal cleavage/methylation domain-containing protein
MGISTKRAHQQRRARQQGLTLIEVMVVVLILGLVAAIAVPALTKDRLDDALYSFTMKFAHDIRRAHMEAISSKDDLQIYLGRDNYRMFVLDVSTGTPTEVSRRQAPNDVIIAGVLGTTAVPGTSYTPPGVDPATRIIKMLATGGMQLGDTSNNFNTSAVTVFLKTLRSNYKSRVVVYPATTQARMYKGW